MPAIRAPIANVLGIHADHSFPIHSPAFLGALSTIPAIATAFPPLSTLCDYWNLSIPFPFSISPAIPTHEPSQYRTMSGIMSCHTLAAHAGLGCICEGGSGAGREAKESLCWRGADGGGRVGYAAEIGMDFA